MILFAYYTNFSSNNFLYPLLHERTTYKKNIEKNVLFFRSYQLNHSK